MKGFTKTILALSVTGLSSIAMASSNPDPFNNEPVVIDNRNQQRDQVLIRQEQQRLIRSEQQANFIREQERELTRNQNNQDPVDALLQDNDRSNEAEVLRGFRDRLSDGIDYENLPRPVDLPELPEIPPPLNFEDLQRGVEDYRLRGTINGMGIEHSGSNNLYRITGEREAPVKIQERRDDSRYQTGGKESFGGKELVVSRIDNNKEVEDKIEIENNVQLHNEIKTIKGEE